MKYRKNSQKLYNVDLASSAVSCFAYRNSTYQQENHNLQMDTDHSLMQIILGDKTEKRVSMNIKRLKYNGACLLIQPESNYLPIINNK